MPRSIHPSATIHPGASLADDVTIGPYCIVDDDVQIGEGTHLVSHVSLLKGTRIGKNCRIWPGTVIGGPPQDHKFRGEYTLVTVGDNNVIRECVTLNRSVGEGTATRIGNDNMFMAYAHVGHNCEVGNSNTVSSYVGLSGHVRLEDNAVLGGLAGVHQFTRIGKLSMIGGCSKVNLDVPPFMTADGVPCRVIDLNKIGLRRYGVPSNIRTTLRQAYKLLYRSQLNLSQAMERIEDELESSEELEYLLKFMRGIQGGFAGRGNYPTRD